MRGVGVVSVGLAGRGAGPAARAGRRRRGAASDDASLPVLVRLNAARQGVLGLALLTRTPVDVRRSAGLFLPLTALDAVAVLLGVRVRRAGPARGRDGADGARRSTSAWQRAAPQPSRWRR